MQVVGLEEREDGSALSGDEFLAELLDAAVRDLEQQRVVDKSHFDKQLRNAGADVTTEVAHWKGRAEIAEREAKALRESLERHDENYRALKTRHRELRRTLGQEPESLPTPEDSAEELPEGVRKRGNGFQAYFRANGDQHQQTFPTLRRGRPVARRRAPGR